MIGPDGRMNEARGRARRASRRTRPTSASLAWLRERGRLEQRESYRHAVGTCERCHTRIEPLVSLQWWCAMEEPRKPALEALRERRVRYHPESQHQFAIRSLEEIPDWNISRQLWWGHQLPLWYCPDGHATCAVAGARTRAPSAARPSSSATPTCSTPGSRRRSGRSRRSAGRSETPELERYYPGDVDSTAREIIRLWVNRMIWSRARAAGRRPVHAT